MAIDFKREDFTLDFTYALSDRSTTDNFVSDEDLQNMETEKKQIIKPLELEQ